MAWAVSIVKIYAGNARIGISKQVSTIAMTDKVALRHSPIPALNPAWRLFHRRLSFRPARASLAPPSVRSPPSFAPARVWQGGEPAVPHAYRLAAMPAAASTAGYPRAGKLTWRRPSRRLPGFRYAPTAAGAYDPGCRGHRRAGSPSRPVPDAATELQGRVPDQQAGGVEEERAAVASQVSRRLARPGARMSESSGG